MKPENSQPTKVRKENGTATRNTLRKEKARPGAKVYIYHPAKQKNEIRITKKNEKEERTENSA